jgi:hypothetical protein
MNIRKSYGVTLKNIVESGYLGTDNEIYHIWFRGPTKGKKILAKILDNGEIFLVKEQIKYGSLTKAAKHYVNRSINGWEWWYYKHEGIGHARKIYTLHDLRNKFLESKDK